MKNYRPILIGLCLLLSSCAAALRASEPTYFGDTFPATSKVDIYYSEHDVKQGYKVIGHMAYTNFAPDVVKAKLSEFAKKIGADAVIITGTEDVRNDAPTGLIKADALKYNN